MLEKERRPGGIKGEKGNNGNMVEGVARAKTRRITIEVEVPLGNEASVEVDKLLELLRKGVPLGVGKEDLRRTKIYGKRSRH